MWRYRQAAYCPDVELRVGMSLETFQRQKMNGKHFVNCIDLSPRPVFCLLPTCSPILMPVWHQRRGWVGSVSLQLLLQFCQNHNHHLSLLQTYCHSPKVVKRNAKLPFTDLNTLSMLPWLSLNMFGQKYKTQQNGNLAVFKFYFIFL